MLGLTHSSFLGVMHKTDWLLVPGVIIVAFVVYCMLAACDSINKKSLSGWALILTIQVVVFVVILVYELTR